MAHTFDDLVTLEQAAVDALAALTAADDTRPAARAAAVDAAAAFQAAVTEYAAAEGESRVDVEMAVKKGRSAPGDGTLASAAHPPRVGREPEGFRLVRVVDAAARAEDHQPLTRAGLAGRQLATRRPAPERRAGNQADRAE